MATKAPELWKWTNGGSSDYYGYDKSRDSFNPYPLQIAAFGTQFGLYFMMVHFYAPEWVAIVVGLILGFMWECKNALVPYINWTNLTADGAITASSTWSRRYFGGFGYSYHREIYGAGGLLIAFLLDVMWPPAIQPSREEEMDSM